MRTLLLEKSDADADLIKRALKSSDLEFEVRIVDTSSESINALDSFSPQVILSDQALRQFSSWNAVLRFIFPIKAGLSNQLTAIT